MKAPFISSKVTDHICPQKYKARRGATSRAKELYADASATELRRRVSYIPDEAPPKQIEKSPRLFIRGLHGGSIDIDLRQLGIRLSEAAFGHWVADESLKFLHVHRGDIAIIDCTHRILREGHLVLLGFGGREVLRRLRKRHRIWYLETVDGSKQDPVPLTDQPMQGTVVGILRLFTRVKPIRYPCKAVDLGSTADTRSIDLRISDDARESDRKPAASTIRQHSSRRQKGVVLAAEDAAPYHAEPRKMKRP